LSSAGATGSGTGTMKPPISPWAMIPGPRPITSIVSPFQIHAQ
jgi:hypothetical protein